MAKSRNLMVQTIVKESTAYSVMHWVIVPASCNLGFRRGRSLKVSVPVELNRKESLVINHKTGPSFKETLQGEPWICSHFLVPVPRTRTCCSVSACENSPRVAHAWRDMLHTNPSPSRADITCSHPISERSQHKPNDLNGNQS